MCARASVCVCVCVFFFFFFFYFFFFFFFFFFFTIPVSDICLKYDCLPAYCEPPPNTNSKEPTAKPTKTVPPWPTDQLVTTSVVLREWHWKGEKPLRSKAWEKI